MKQLLVLLMLFPVVLPAQHWPLKRLVNEKKATITFRQLQPFLLGTTRQLDERGAYHELSLQKDFTQMLVREKPAAIRLVLPISAKETIYLELVLHELGVMKFTTNGKEEMQQVKVPVTYHGVIAGESPRNNVVLTAGEDYLSLMAASYERVLQVVNADTEPGIYRLYNSNTIRFPEEKLVCGTKEVRKGTEQEQLRTRLQNYRAGSSADKCVQLFIDCFDSLYQWRGNSQVATLHYVYELFNYVSTGFLNEQVNIKIQQVNIWTDSDPFNKTNRDSARNSFAAFYQDNFWGNAAVGLDYSISNVRRFGIAGKWNGEVKGVAPNTCPTYDTGSHQFMYNDVNYGGNYTNFPTGGAVTQGAVYLVMHELGHQLGSPHTKWCGWPLPTTPPSFGALDSCDAPEGMCAKGPPPPDTGATIMSYCISGVGGGGGFVNFNAGFGELPGNAVRAFVANTACIPECTNCSTTGSRTATGIDPAIQYINAPKPSTPAIIIQPPDRKE